jgi:hypothetical protein
MTPTHSRPVEDGAAVPVGGAKVRYSIFGSRKPSPELGVLVRIAERSSAAAGGSVGSAAVDPHVRLERRRTQDLVFLHLGPEKI